MTTLPNSLTRDSIVLAARMAGCSPEGTLLASLSDTPALANTNLEQQSSYKIYKQQMAPFTVLTDGSASVERALDEFKAVKALTTEDSKLGSAARDLCLERNLDSYNFCNDVTNTTIVNSTNISCLQAKYLQGGGKKTDPSYPLLERSLGKTFYL
jgi:hypothetical protein